MPPPPPLMCTIIHADALCRVPDGHLSKNVDEVLWPTGRNSMSRCICLSTTHRYNPRLDDSKGGWELTWDMEDRGVRDFFYMKDFRWYYLGTYQWIGQSVVPQKDIRALIFSMSPIVKLPSRLGSCCSYSQYDSFAAYALSVQKGCPLRARHIATGFLWDNEDHDQRRHSEDCLYRLASCRVQHSASRCAAMRTSFDIYCERQRRLH